MSVLHPAVAATRRAVAEAVAGLDAGTLVLVACSGGADSTALAAATAFVAPRRGLRAGAVVVDHGLQSGSAAVADRAAASCESLGLSPVEVRTVQVLASGAGPEADARRERYAALESAAAELGAATVLLGHTLDDQAETVLLGLARGSGARSLAGMAARRGVLRRPLLGVTRAQTEAACNAEGLAFWTDPTNEAPPGSAARADPGAPDPGAVSSTVAGVGDEFASRVDLSADAGWPLRSRVRAEVMPALKAVLGAGAVLGLARTADLLRDDADALDDLAACLLTAARRPDGLDVAVLADGHRAVRRRALRLAAVEAGAPPGDLFAVHVVALDALVVDWHGQGHVSLPSGLRCARSCGRLLFEPPAPQE